MSALLARIQGDLNAARKAQDKARTMLISTLLSEAKNRRIELMRELTEDEVVEVLRRGIKRRRESIEAFTKGNREELAEKERAEVAILETYLPAEIDPEEIRAAVREAIAGGAANIGAVMGKIMPRFKGKAEGGTINAIAREELGKQG
jgi:uncharacterized protein YqeY